MVRNIQGRGRGAFTGLGPATPTKPEPSLVAAPESEYPWGAAMATRLSDCLVRDGLLRGDVVRAATARQAVYGGTLDTAVLELGLLDEPTLWNALSISTGAPIPDPVAFENPDPRAAAAFDAAWSRRCHAVPFGQSDGKLQICCSEPVGEAELAAARAALGLSFEIFVVPEVRLAAARQAVYGEPMPPRLLRVLARLVGAQPVRKWASAMTPQRARPAPAPSPAPAAGALVDGELAEAEFDVPVNTYATGPADILESRASRAVAGAAAAEAAAADEVARALAGPDAPAPMGEAGSIPEPPPRAHSRTPLGRPTLIASDPAAERLDLMDPDPASELLGEPRDEGPGVHDDDEAQLCAVADDAESEARLAALRVLRSRLGRPRVRAFADKLRADLEAGPERAILAAAALGELRDGEAVPALIDALGGSPSVARVAAGALVEIAQQDFGHSRKKWLAWWEQHKGAERVAWLLEGLSHRSPEIRFSSSEELRLITGEYFGYHFDLPKREREEARERWRTWWYQSGRAQSPDRQ